MKNARAIVEVGFVPYVCADCGNMQLMADLARGNAPGNCNICEGWNVRRAGTEQIVMVSIFREAAKIFRREESKP